MRSDAASEVERVSFGFARRIHAPTSAHTVTESFALLGRHVLPASPTARATATVHAESAKEDAAQHQQAERLPERDLPQNVSASLGSSTRRRMKFRSRACSFSNTSDTRWSSSRVIRSGPAASSIYWCRRIRRADIVWTAGSGRASATASPALCLGDAAVFPRTNHDRPESPRALRPRPVFP